MIDNGPEDLGPERTRCALCSRGRTDVAFPSPDAAACAECTARVRSTQKPLLQDVQRARRMAALAKELDALLGIGDDDPPEEQERLRNVAIRRLTGRADGSLGRSLSEARHEIQVARAAARAAARFGKSLRDILTGGGDQSLGLEDSESRHTDSAPHLVEPPMRPLSAREVEQTLSLHRKEQQALERAALRNLKDGLKAARRASRDPVQRLREALIGGLAGYDAGSGPSLDSDFAAIVSAVEQVLGSRSRDILLARWGFSHWPAATLDDLGSQFAITRERARQIQARGEELLQALGRTGVGNQLKAFARAVEILASSGGLLADHEYLAQLAREGVVGSPGAVRMIGTLADLKLWNSVRFDDELQLWLTAPATAASPQLVHPDEAFIRSWRSALKSARSSLRERGAVDATHIQPPPGIPLRHVVALAARQVWLRENGDAGDAVTGADVLEVDNDDPSSGHGSESAAGISASAPDVTAFGGRPEAGYAALSAAERLASQAAVRDYSDSQLVSAPGRGVIPTLIVGTFYVPFIQGPSRVSVRTAALVAVTPALTLVQIRRVLRRRKGRWAATPTHLPIPVLHAVLSHSNRFRVDRARVWPAQRRHWREVVGPPWAQVVERMEAQGNVLTIPQILAVLFEQGYPASWLQAFTNQPYVTRVGNTGYGLIGRNYPEGFTDLTAPRPPGVRRKRIRTLAWVDWPDDVGRGDTDPEAPRAIPDGPVLIRYRATPLLMRGAVFLPGSISQLVERHDRGARSAVAPSSQLPEAWPVLASEASLVEAGRELGTVKLVSPILWDLTAVLRALDVQSGDHLELAIDFSQHRVLARRVARDVAEHEQQLRDIRLRAASSQRRAAKVAEQSQARQEERKQLRAERTAARAAERAQRRRDARQQMAEHVGQPIPDGFIAIRDEGAWHILPDTTIDLSDARYYRLSRGESPFGDALVVEFSRFPLPPAVTGVAMAVVITFREEDGIRREDVPEVLRGRPLMRSMLVERVYLARARELSLEDAVSLLPSLLSHLERKRLVLMTRETHTPTGSEELQKNPL